MVVIVIEDSFSGSGSGEGDLSLHPFSQGLDPQTHPWHVWQECGMMFCSKGIKSSRLNSGLSTHGWALTLMLPKGEQGLQYE